MPRGASKRSGPGGLCLPGLAHPGAGSAPDRGSAPYDAAPHGVGVDEAGRGCLAGPVVAAAVYFSEDFDFAGQLPGLDDSKRLSLAERERLAALIPELCEGYGLGLAWQDEIDAVNILNATFRAMSRAVLALAERLERRNPARSASLPPPSASLPPPSQCLSASPPPSPLPSASALSQSPPLLPPANLLPPLLLIDGDKVIPEAQWLYCAQGLSLEALAWEQYFPLPLSSLPERIPDLPRQMAVVGGDALLPCISAASIMAKTVRDGIMSRLDGHFPGYGLARHKGYGTREHLEAIERNGPSALHRKSFRGVCPEAEKTGNGQLPLPYPAEDAAE